MSAIHNAESSGSDHMLRVAVVTTDVLQILGYGMFCEFITTPIKPKPYTMLIKGESCT